MANHSGHPHGEAPWLTTFSGPVASTPAKSTKSGLEVELVETKDFLSEKNWEELWRIREMYENVD